MIVFICFPRNAIWAQVSQLSIRGNIFDPSLHPYFDFLFMVKVPFPLMVSPFGCWDPFGALEGHPDALRDRV